MKLNNDQRERIKRMVDQADRDGATYTELVKMLRPFYSTRTVERMLKEVREKREGKG